MKRLNIMRNALGGVELFISLGALAAGFGLMTEPSGAGVGLSQELLVGTPFPDYLIPGIVLFIGIGLGNLLGAFLTFSRHSRAGNTGVLFGILLIGWISFQIYWIGFFPFLQLLMMFCGAAEIWLGFRLLRARVFTSKR